MSRPDSERVRRRLSAAVMAGYFAVAPHAVPPARFDLRHRPVAVLVVGEGTPSLATRPRPPAD